MPVRRHGSWWNGGLLAMMLAVLAASTASVHGAAGDLDPSFDGDGMRVLGSGGDALAIQPDQKIVVAGGQAVRLLPNGANDPSFGVGGVAPVTFLPGAFDGRAVAVQANGGILVAGQYLNGGTTGFGLVRLQPDGTTDAMFGTGGSVLGPLDGLADAAIEQTDGRIVLAGTLSNGLVSRVALARYDANGAPDLGFGTAGVVSFDLAPGFQEIFVDLVQDAAGRLVAVGAVQLSNVDWNVVVARFDAAGVPDTSFAGSGILILPVQPGPDFPHQVALQPDGAIIVVGNTSPENTGNNLSLMLLRVLDDGTLDPTFGIGGIAVSLVGGFSTIGRGVALQADGRIVVATTVVTPTHFQPAVARFLVDGTPDPSFGTGGAVVSSLANGGDVAEEGILMQVDGRIVVSVGAFGGAVFRYLAGCGDGTLDPGETCDDGNRLDGDCCSSSCQVVPSGTSCDDGLFCNGADVCDGTTCTHVGDPCVGGGECADQCNEAADDCNDPLGVPCTSDAVACTLDRCDGAGTCAHPAVPDGGACDDGDTCTAGDSCMGGACASGAPVVCGPCRACVPAIGCAAAIRMGCKTTPHAAGRLLLRDAGNDAADTVKFAWTKGQATTFAELGSPTTSDDYALCLFDADADVVTALSVPAGGTCGTKACWKQLGSATTPKGYKYKDVDGLPTDVDGLILKAGATGKASMSLKARGANVPMPSLGGLALPLTVQLQSEGGQCWAATFGTPQVTSSVQFKARSD